MISFDLTPAQEELKRRVEGFTMDIVAPYEKDPRNTPHGPTDELRIELNRLAREAGLFAPHLPRRWGGMGFDHVTTAIVFEAAGLSPLGPIAMHCAAPDEGNMNLLDKVATEEQKERWLKPFAAGRIRSCFSMTEPWGAGADPSKMKTSAVYDGDDLVVHGVKWLITGARGAGFTIIFCHVEASEGRPGGPTMLISDMDAPGIELTRELDTLDSSFTNGHWEVTFAGLRVPIGNVLGQIGEGFRYVQVRLAPARLTHCMRWLGGAVRAHRIALDYARRREAFGRPIGQHGEIGAMLADNELELQQCRLMIWWAAKLLDKGDHARHESSMVKTMVSEALYRVADRCVQILGGMGVTSDTVVAQIFRETRAFRLYDGPSEVHKWAISRKILKNS
ncbi:acyl-CoA dehydrogenase [Paracoccus aestuarii]|uniref:Acyl-CoA dehydrogenase n=1 Tax=Paracoccus aestuarii TaxID=453842 RepID=A0A418ZYI6_9RHOB|nr:acyl-CoA dehydrogenase family protein [Paracoccus aestuarii]RJL05527.1 acyl-CoA dehydrogenase [Paracoccus aestuarii]WCQ98606.1 acyl-CoA dehydrogenase family protein [Paracoccus aestuarii]